MLTRHLGLSTTGQIIVAGAATFEGGYFTNSGAAAAYVKFYDKATAPTSSDTPVLTLLLPAGGGANPNLQVAFDVGLSVRACIGAADNDNTAPGANEVIAHTLYSKNS